MIHFFTVYSLRSDLFRSLFHFTVYPPVFQRPRIQNARRVAYLEGLNEPSNVGAIFRAAAALGLDAVLLSPDCADPWHRRAVLVKYNGHVYAASMNGMPHGTQTITNNGFEGHFCIHFYRSKTHGTKKVDSNHQNCVSTAMKYTW